MSIPFWLEDGVVPYIEIAIEPVKGVVTPVAAAKAFVIVIVLEIVLIVHLLFYAAVDPTVI